MAWNEHRFKVIRKEGSSFSEVGIRQILVDRETGVHYLLWKAGYGAGITPLLGADGKPVVDLSDI